MSKGARMNQREKMTTASLVRRHVASVAYGKIFFTRDCLNYGRRAAVDQILCRLVRHEVITRVARGAFVKLKRGVAIPSLADIALGKAKAFGRKPLLGAYAIARKLIGIGAAEHSNVIATDGATTSFNALDERIYLNCYAPRKLMLADTAHGQVIRLLWKVGRYNITDEMVRDATARLSQIEKAELRRSCHVMPAWLADLLAFSLKTAQACGVRP
jgi:hypothetical protein